MKATGPEEKSEAYLPHCAPIDAYGNGGFRFADMSHRGPILCLPRGISRWSATRAEGLSAADFSLVLEDAGIEMFLIGMGADFRPLPGELKALFKQAGIAVDPMSTGAAVRTYNILLSEARAVGCGLIPVM